MKKDGRQMLKSAQEEPIQAHRQVNDKDWISITPTQMTPSIPRTASMRGAVSDEDFPI